jgi:hypothetical protein
MQIIESFSNLTFNRCVELDYFSGIGKEKGDEFTLSRRGEVIAP